MFIDRTDAGQQLAKKLAKYSDTNAVVLALPRGGVVLGAEIAKAISAPLDIIAVRKIGHPLSPEYAIGVVDERGTTIFNETEVAAVDRDWLQQEVAAEQQEAARRSQHYRDQREPVSLKGKTAIIVDDGIATGFTMQLALRSVNAQSPEQVIVAVPAAPPEAIQMLKAEGVGEVIVLEPPEHFLGWVGAHYRHFSQTTDAEVLKLMRECHANA